MDDVYSTPCTFPSATPVTDCTNGWDAVYAVKYSTINADIAIRAPWTAIVDPPTSTPGVFNQSVGSTSLTNAKISGLAVALGGSGQTVAFTLTVQSATLDAGSGPVPLGAFTVGFQGELSFVSPAGQPGLASLTINSAQPLTLTSVSMSAADALYQLPVQVVMTNFFQRTDVPKKLFTAPFAAVITKDYAGSVNVPWLAPASVNYGVADLVDVTPATDGALAVFTKNTANVAGLNTQFQPQAFPTNGDVNAAVLISAQCVAANTFIKQLNNDIGASIVGPFVTGDTPGSLVNENEINAYYRVATDGSLEFVENTDDADSTGPTYPATIAPGALVFSVADGGITASIKSVSVDLQNGYKVIMTMDSSFQIVADSTGDVDIVLQGDPEVTTSLDGESSDDSDASPTLLGAAAMLAGIAAGEVIPFIADRVTNLATNVGMTTSRLGNLNLDFIASLRQMRDTNVAVSMDIGARRRLVVARAGRLGQQPEGAGAAFKLTDQYQQSLRLKPDWQAPDRAGQLQLPNRLPPNGMPPATAPDFLARATLYLSPAVMADFTAAVAKGVTDPGAVRTTIQRIQAKTNPNWDQLDPADYQKVYTNCANYLLDGVLSGKIGLSPYINILREFPGCSEAPGITTSLFSNTLRGFTIKTIAGSTVTVPPDGYFSDLRDAMGTGRAGLGATLVSDVILKAPRPLLEKMIGIGLYICGAFGGFYLGNYAQSKVPSGSSSSSGGDADSPAAQTAAKFEADAKSDPGSVLFQTVDFQLMTPATTGSSPPAPSTVLKAAGINGGLVLGVAIPTGVS